MPGADDDLDPMWDALAVGLGERLAEHGLLGWALDQISTADRAEIEQAWQRHATARPKRIDEQARAELEQGSR